MSEFERSARSQLRRHPERGTYDRSEIHCILDEALVCHVAIGSESGPRVVPMFHARIDSNLYLHGAPASQLLRAVAKQQPLCVACTLLDGLVFARSALHHSMNYRSVVIHGTGREVVDLGEKKDALDALVEHAAPGRSKECRPPSDEELENTLVVAVEIREATAKRRCGPAEDAPGDRSLPHWAGVLPLRLLAGRPEPEQGLDFEVPSSIQKRWRWMQG